MNVGQQVICGRSLYRERRVCNKISVDMRERRHVVGVRLFDAHDVAHFVASRSDGVRDQRAMATPGHGLSAHDGESLASTRQRDEVVESVPEIAGQHVVRETPERR